MQKAYACNITYVTGQELGFSYLRDNTAATEYDLVGLCELGVMIVVVGQCTVCSRVMGNCTLLLHE